MPPTIPDGSTANTPLAPSVEKAYYRKCIELKRRLNEVELSNEEARLRRIRLDRSIMKMRLERAFLLEQLSKRMDNNNDGSEPSGDEQINTPPPDRPHRDKRRKVTESGAAPSSTARPDAQTRESPNVSPTQRQRDVDSNSNIDIDRKAGVVGEAVSAGPIVHEDSNGQRRTT